MPISASRTWLLTRGDGLPWSALLAELAAVLLLLMVFVTAATAVSSRGSPHADEVMDGERAINIVHGSGPISFAHPQDAPGARSASVAPAYDYALAGWLGLWGISRIAVVSFNVVIVAVVTLALWGFLYRTALVRQARLRLLAAALLPLLPALSVIYSTNRYDSIGMLALTLACLSLTIRAPGVRRMAIACFAILVGMGGLHVVIASAPLALLGVVFSDRKLLPELYHYGAGLALGLGAVFGMMVWSGALVSFQLGLQMNGVAPPASLIPYLLAPLKGGHSTVLLGGNLLLLLALLLGLVAALIRPSVFSWRTALTFGIGAGIAVPVTLTLFGRYSDTYTWLAAIPMLLCVIIAMDQELLSRLVTRAMLVLATGAALSGFPVRAGVTATEWSELGYERPAGFVARQITPADTVYTTFVGYYPVKQFATNAYFGSAFHAMTPAQRQSITLAIIGGEFCSGGMFEPSAQEAQEAFGGEWSLMDHLTIPRGALRTKIPPAVKEPYSFDIWVYRRSGSGD